MLEGRENFFDLTQNERTDIIFPKGCLSGESRIFRFCRDLSNKTSLQICYYIGKDMTGEKLDRYVVRLKEGDAQAFDYIYERTHRAVYFAVFYILRDKMLAEDVLQDTFVRALSALEQYTPGTNFTAWLCKVGKSIALNTLKKRGRETVTDLSADPGAYGTQETSLPFVFDLARKVLSEEEYEIVMLCQVAGYKRREVAEMTGLPIGTVTWKNNEALKKLKKALEKEGSL